MEGCADGLLVSDRVGLDERTFIDAANQQSAQLFRVAFAILDDRGEAEDAVQDALWKVWRARDRAPGSEAELGRWCFRVCVNTCLSRRSALRLRGFRRQGADDELGRVPVWQTHRTDGAGDDLRRALSMLSRKQRAAIVLRHYPTPPSAPPGG